MDKKNRLIILQSLQQNLCFNYCRISYSTSTAEKDDLGVIANWAA